MAHRPYRTKQHKAASGALKRNGAPCWKCGGVATQIDHVPPLVEFPQGEWQGDLVPVCQRCNASHGARLANARRGARRRNATDTPRSKMWQ
jgi:5-methylcytosine-specific restriction endonuclease McrA